MEPTLVRLKSIFSGSSHLGEILLIFAVILCPALGSRDLINIPPATVSFCRSKRLQSARVIWYCQKQGFLYDASHTQLWHWGSVTTKAPLNEEGKRSERGTEE